VNFDKTHLLLKEGIHLFHERLKKLREQENISREHLADSLSITYSALSKYETGKREPDFKLLQKIASYFNVTTDYLLGNTDECTKPLQQDNDMVCFQASNNNPELQEFYNELAASDEESVKHLRDIWEIIKQIKK